MRPRDRQAHDHRGNHRRQQQHDRSCRRNGHAPSAPLEHGGRLQCGRRALLEILLGGRAVEEAGGWVDRGGVGDAEGEHTLG